MPELHRIAGLTDQERHKTILQARAGVPFHFLDQRRDRAICLFISIRKHEAPIVHQRANRRRRCEQHRLLCEYGLERDPLDTGQVDTLDDARALVRINNRSLLSIRFHKHVARNILTIPFHDPAKLSRESDSLAKHIQHDMLIILTDPQQKHREEADTHAGRAIYGHQGHPIIPVVIVVTARDPQIRILTGRQLARREHTVSRRGMATLIFRHERGMAQPRPQQQPFQ